MDIGTISSRYAQALFSVSREMGQEKQVYDEMLLLTESFSQQPELQQALVNPILPREKKWQLLTAAGGVEVSALYTRFIQLVLQQKRENRLLFMAHQYIHLYRKAKRITRVQLESAVPINEAVQLHLQEKLKEACGTTLEFAGVVRPDLIGGFRLRIGNIRMDASYATQLREIRKRFIEQREKERKV